MSKPFNIHNWQAKQRQQLLNEADGPVSRGEGQKERLVQTLVNVFDGRLGNWYSDSPTNMNDVQKLFNRDREAIANMIRSHLRDVNVDPNSDFARPLDIDEHHDDEEFPGKDLSAWDLLDKMKTSQPELYKSVEDFMKQMNEMSTTGGGASFSAGAGEGYMKPLEVKKKRK